MILLTNLITGLLSTLIVSFSFALYQYYPVETAPGVSYFSFSSYFQLDFLYIGTVYLFIVLPLSIFINKKISSYPLRFLIFLMMGLIIGTLLSLYIYSEVPIDPIGIFTLYGLASFAAAAVYFHIYLLVAKLFNKNKT